MGEDKCLCLIIFVQTAEKSAKFLSPDQRIQPNAGHAAAGISKKCSLPIPLCPGHLKTVCPDTGIPRAAVLLRDRGMAVRDPEVAAEEADIAK